MHIIIPMSGVGQRFLDAGYVEPKPLIEIDGKPIIAHVVDLFPGENKFTFICNEVHLAETNMRETLENIAPSATILSIPQHKLGPVYAVAQIYDYIDDHEEVIVNYCDFGTYWDYSDFLDHTRSRGADGAIPSYKGFHPHMLGSTNYAFMRDENQWMLEIQEKKPFTDNRMNEYASNGTYYFRTGAIVKQYFSELMASDEDLNGEYYVSNVYNLLVRDGLKVSIYNIQHMLQWGTPQDVSEYLAWSDYFSEVMRSKEPWLPENNSYTLIPLAGRGSRFSIEGYTLPKPLLEVSGKPMIIQAHDSLPESKSNVFVCLGEHCQKYQLDEKIQQHVEDCQIIELNEVTEGQAITCDIGLHDVPDDAPLLIAACDNGMLWNEVKYRNLIDDPTIDAIIWTFKGHPSTTLNPQMYGWVETAGEKALRVSVKQEISGTPAKDQAVVGSFYFRRVDMFRRGLAALQAKNIRVNNEFYVDSLMDELIKLGLNVYIFEIDAYIGWGTPGDYRTFNYWQSFFHKWPGHPYKIQADPTVDEECYQRLIDSFHDFKQDYH